jgi:hypothetical protein
MRGTVTLLACLLFFSGYAQDLTGIWRGTFVSADSKLMDVFKLEDRYKYEVQIDQRNKAFSGVTYSYKTTVFYGKASASGTVNPKTGKVMLNELKLLELKMSQDSYACWMVCFLQYTKNGDEEFLEGRYSSYRENDSSFCGRGTVTLRKVVTSDFYREPFLVKRQKEIAEKKQQELAQQNKPKTTPAITTPQKQVVAKKTTTPPPVVAKNNTRTNTAKTNVVKPKTEKEKVEAPAVDPKSSSLIAKVEPDKKEPVIKTKDPVIVPMVLKSRENEVVQSITVATNEITIDIYDNGTIDHDTVSVYLDKKIVVSRQMLKTTPITVKLKMDESSDYHELVMVAENLGDIPPNTSLMIVKAGEKRYEVRITSTEQKNAVVIFKYEKPAVIK